MMNDAVAKNRPIFFGPNAGFHDGGEIFVWGRISTMNRTRDKVC
ncbi:hypothetical protein SF83666_c23130 [Sinorhizobium fredii CCBAU 83666]|nr:hypothetical protein SF83666_c23130 [Sinorhizobium fredii CCBAU 83666]